MNKKYSNLKLLQPTALSDQIPEKEKICCNCLLKLKRMRKREEIKKKKDVKHPTMPKSKKQLNHRENRGLTRQRFKFEKRTVNKSCQYRSYLGNMSNCVSQYCQDIKTPMGNFIDPYPVEERNRRIEGSENSDISIEKDIESQYPDTSLQSLASYHSFLSTDQEPMVSDFKETMDL